MGELVERLKRESGVYEAEDARAVILACDALIALVVAECAKVCEDAEGEDRGYDPEDPASVGWNDAARSFANRICNHFGDE